MSEPRKAIVKQAYELLDEAGKGAIPLEVLTKKYFAQGHPRVRTREKAPEAVQKDFETAITKWA